MLAQQLTALTIIWLDSQHPRDAPEASLTPVPGDSMLSAGLPGHCMHSAQINTQAKHSEVEEKS